MAEEVERLRELLKEKDAALTTLERCFNVQNDELIQTKARLKEKIDECDQMRNKLEYYRNTVRAIRVPIEGEIS